MIAVTFLCGEDAQEWSPERDRRIAHARVGVVVRSDGSFDVIKDNLGVTRRRPSIRSFKGLLMRVAAFNDTKPRPAGSR